MKAIRVSLSVTSEEPEVVTRAVEAMSRSMAGLALEGVTAFLMAAEEEEEGE